MPRVIISDTSCFIILSKIDKLDILKQVYGEVTTTVDIANEYGESLPEWVRVIEVNDKNRQALLEMQIDKGESSAIALALEISNSSLILDDYKARKVADQLKIPFTGTIGIIIKAKRLGHISLVKPVLERIKQSDFRISDEIEAQALREAGE
tara:strand:+ start:786 stop:1241 length:456 start_codon:yes stop_codon:yes gene_type:complete